MPLKTHPKFWRMAFTAILFLCVLLPIFYIVIYRPLDYYFCRGAISVKLGMSFSPFTLEGYVEKSLLPGMTREDVLATLEKIGRVKVVPLGRVNDIWSEQITLSVCTDYFNRIIIFSNYSEDGDLISIKILDD
jgi:hypothetical protein